MCREALVFSLLIPLAGTATAGDAPRLDRFGDPLPDGAIFRLGTTRFRPPHPHGQFVLSPDGKVFATGEKFSIWNDGTREKNREFSLWDAETGKVLWSHRLPDGINCVWLLFSPDNRKLMIIAAPREIYRYKGLIFEVATGKLLSTISPPRTAWGGLRHWRFAADGTQLLTAEEFVYAGRQATCGYTGCVTISEYHQPVIPVLWDLQTGKEVWRLPATSAVALSPDAKTIASTTHNAIGLWDLVAKKDKGELRSDHDWYCSMDWSADGKTFAAIGRRNSGNGNPRKSAEYELVCWDVDTKKVRRAWAVDRKEFAISPDGKYVATIDHQSRLEIREVSSGQTLPGKWLYDNLIMAIVPTVHTNCDGYLAFTPDGALLVRDRYHAFRRFDVATGLRLPCPPVPPDHDPYQGFALTRDGKTILRSQTFIFGDVASGVDRAALGQHVSEIQQLIVARQEPFLLSQDKEGDLKVWDLTTGRELSKPTLGPTQPRCFGFLEDGQTVVAVGTDAAVTVWEARTRKIVRKFSLADSEIGWDWYKYQVMNDHRKKEDWLSLSADKRTVAIAGNRRFAVWDVTTGRCIKVWTTAEGIEKIELAADGKSIATTTRQSLIVLTVDDKQRYRFVRNGQSWVILSPDGRWFAHVGQELSVYEVATGKKCNSLAFEDGTGWVIAFNSNNSISFVSPDRSVRFCDLENGNEITPLDRLYKWSELWQQVNPLPPDTILWPYLYELSFRCFSAEINQNAPQYQSTGRYIRSRDNRFVACAEEENIAIFEIRTGKKIASFDAAPKGDIKCVVFARDSRMLITGSSNSTILVWDWLNAAKLGSAPKVRPDASAWDELAGDDASKAFRTMNMLAQHPREALQLLHERLKPAKKQETEKDQYWIANLDDFRFPVRERARTALLLRGEDALPQLQKSLKRPLSSQAETSVSRLIAAMAGGGSREGTRQVRAIQALEWINTPESRQLLRDLADGEPNALRTKEAAKALQRR